jgi:CheY-like chemotaxis protein
MLAGGVAHDFNNLLGTLLGHVGLLRLQQDHDRVQERLDRMEQTIERASLVTRRLLAVGGRSENAPADIDVEEVIDEAVEIAEPALPEGIELEVAVDGPLPVVRISDEDLRHVLLNLILNARDALESDGHIHIAAEAAVDGGVRICVSDDGPGVPDGLRERVFQPFFTTKGTDKGTGLGLPMARRLLHRHGAHIELEEPTDGSSGALFVLTLPPADGTPIPIRHAVGATVAVVDDEPALCAAYAAALETAGYHVVTFRDGHEALRKLAANPPHVLVTDVVMPGMSGLELAAGLRELYPRLPVLVVSGYVPTSERTLDGATEHLDKPVRPVRIVEAIGRLLGSMEGASDGLTTTPAPGRHRGRA